MAENKPKPKAGPNEGVADKKKKRVKKSVETYNIVFNELCKTGNSLLVLSKPKGSSAKHASGGQKPPPKPVIVSQPFPLKKTSALFDIINELESVAKPYPNLAIPNDYFIQEYLGQKLPMFEKVGALASHQGDLVFELRLDVWPIPDYCMLHGIWPCYIHKSGWIIYFCPDDTIDTALATERRSHRGDQ